MLRKRVITALILLPLALFAIFFLSLETFSLVVALIILIGFWEWTGFISKISLAYRVGYLLLSAGLMWFIYKNSLPLGYWHGWVFPEQLTEWFKIRDAALISLLLGCLWWIFALVLVLKFPKYSQYFINNIFLMFIIGWLLLIPTWVALTGIRSIGMTLDYNRGSGLLLFALCLVWAADTGAFIVGKLFGKHKLAPQISPKKTWEGVIGGFLLASGVAVVAIEPLAISDSTLPGLTLLILVIVIFSVVGDLTESIFKRLSGKKDSGHILPGHGGILDRIDALTSAMPLCLLGFVVLDIT